MDDDDLSLVDTNAMLDELERRFDCIVFAGQYQRTEGELTMLTRFRGSYDVGIGLAHQLIDKILRKIRRTTRRGGNT